MRSRLLVPVFAALAACSHHHHVDGGTPVPVFAETERNDDPLTANHFGVLLPGDHFFIDGFVRDDVTDPFDGFAFTAGSALHVDFQLFIGNAAADLDVCLYDPQIDQTVACFATADDPERGGVDVSAGGLDFHLVVESFTGDATYSLEIVVQPLFAASAASQRALAPQAGIAGVDARAERKTAAEELYLREKPSTRPVVVIEQRFEIDRLGNSVLAIVHVRRPDDF